MRKDNDRLLRKDDDGLFERIAIDLQKMAIGLGVVWLIVMGGLV